MTSVALWRALSGLSLAIIVLLYVFFTPTPTTTEAAHRMIVHDGNLYRASDFLRAGRITNSNDVRILFEEKRNMLLVGKGFEGSMPDSEATGGTQLHLMSADGSSEEKISDALVTFAKFDPSGKNIFYLTEAGDIYRYNVETKVSTQIASEGSIFDVSPDGERLVYGKAPPGWTPGEYFEGTPGIVVLDIQNGSERLILPTPPWQSGLSNDYSPLWTPDGEHILFFNSGLWIANADGSQRTQLTKPGDGTDAYGISADPLWSSDGRYFLYHADAVVRAVKLDIRNRRVLSAGPIADGVGPRWVEEGKTISVLDPDAKIGERALSIVDLDGRVIQGDRSREIQFRTQSGASLRIAPRPVPPQPSPTFNNGGEIIDASVATTAIREITPAMIIWSAPEMGVQAPSGPPGIPVRVDSMIETFDTRKPVPPESVHYAD